MDINLLAALRERSRFRQLRAAVPDSMVGQETLAMLGWYKAYFDAFPEKDFVEIDSLRSLFTLRAGTATPEQKAVMAALFDRLDQPVDPDIIKGITYQLYTNDMSGRAAALINRYDEGDEVDLTYELGRLARENMQRLGATTPSSYIDSPIEDILADLADDRGLKLPTMALKEHVGGLQGGDLLGVAGRPDKGKTSLVAAILTGFAPQLRSMGWAGRPIVWFNNEGNGRRIIPRIYQAALGIDFQTLIDMSNKGTLTAAYSKAMDGQEIRVKDMHGATFGQMEQVIEEMNPAVVVYDMVANFRMAGQAAGGNKTDAEEAKWQEAREIAVRHNHVAVGTIQVSADGDDTLYPPYGALKDSKTSVQGTLDVQLMMGALNAPEMAALRGLSTPKNKRQIVGKPSHVQAQVYFDSQTCQFTDGA